jgi:carbamoyl-phosphate synthase large subunit
MRILVTAIGGDIGYGIGKILRKAGIAEHLVGCDVHREHAGRFYFDQCDVVPRADSSDYVSSLLRVAKANRVDLIIPTSEPELRYLVASNTLSDLQGIPLLLVNQQSLRSGFDKLQTAALLRQAGLPFPWTGLVGDGPPQALPCIIKERFGAGSRGLSIVDEELAPVYMRTRSADIWQELLHPADQEHTCGLYRTMDGDIRTIVFRRKLVAGVTTYGKVVRNHPQIEQLLVRLAEVLELRGSINVQLMLTDNGPRVFEINPRFSSTVVFRHLLGFQDVLWSIAERFGGAVPPYKPPRDGSAFYRGVDELMLGPGTPT